MNKEEKAAVIAGLAARLKSTEAVLVADFRGLTVKELAELRRSLRGAEAEFAVVKNTLTRRAAGESGREGLLPYLDGPTGLVWVNGDPARAAKALSDFVRGHTGRIAVKGGYMGPHDVPPAAVARLAALPPREQLLQQLASGVAAPLTGLAGAMSNLIAGLARSLAALLAQREAEGAESAPAA